MVDHNPRRTELVRVVREYLAGQDGYGPSEDEVDAVVLVLTGCSEALWLGLEEQGLVSRDRWSGFDGRRFERRYEREFREEHGEALRQTEEGPHPAGAPAHSGLPDHDGSARTAP
jgi:hypothetical protein